MFRKAIPVALLLATGVTACAHAPSAQTSAQQLVDARFATFNKHDLDGIVKLYSPDAVLTSPGFCSPGRVRRERVGPTATCSRPIPISPIRSSLTWPTAITSQYSSWCTWTNTRLHWQAS